MKIFLERMLIGEIISTTDHGLYIRKDGRLQRGSTYKSHFQANVGGSVNGHFPAEKVELIE